jgi:hypothetical protein
MFTKFPLTKFPVVLSDQVVSQLKLKKVDPLLELEYKNVYQNSFQTIKQQPEIEARFPIRLVFDEYYDVGEARNVASFLNHLFKTQPECLQTNEHELQTFTINSGTNNRWCVKGFKFDHFELSPGPNSSFMISIKKSQPVNEDTRFNVMIQIHMMNVGNSVTTSWVVRFEHKDHLQDFCKQMNEFEIALKTKKTDLTVWNWSEDDGGWLNSLVKIAPSWDTYFVKDEIQALITQRIDAFLCPKYKDRCLKFGKPYKLNILLYGVPGAGKTTMIKLLAKKYKKELYCFNLSKEITDSKFNRSCTKIKDSSIVAYEDIDSFFIQREGSKDTNISFSAMINVLDGIKMCDKGLITFLTANHVDNLDPAMIRPGRMDLIVKFDYPEAPEIFKAFKSLTNVSPEKAEEIFNVWYKPIRNLQIPMSGITDFLFQHPDDYLECVDELVKSHKALKQMLTDANQDKMYL